jgi:hypothetical protein
MRGEFNYSGPDLAFPPSSTLVFIVGVCTQWEDGRDAVGDVRHCSILFMNIAEYSPLNHMKFVRDDEATAQAVKSETRNFLQEHGTVNKITLLSFIMADTGAHQDFAPRPRPFCMSKLLALLMNVSAASESGF